MWMKQQRKKVMYLFWICTLSFVLLTTAAFAWMSIADILRVTDMEVNVVVDNQLLIAFDVDGEPGEWSTMLSLEELITEEMTLKPVTYSAVSNSILAPDYGDDGRLDFSSPTTLVDLSSENSIPSTDVAESIEGDGFILEIPFWIKSDSVNSLVYLSQPTEQVESVAGIGSFVVGAAEWSTSTYTHTNAGGGAENAIRIGFRVFTDSEDLSQSEFYIYEPNADSSGTVVDTPSVDGTDTLISSEYLIQQEVSSWTETSPILSDTVNYTTGSFIGDDVVLMTLEEEAEPYFVIMYIWLEGQDVECTNVIEDSSLDISIQFRGEMYGDEEIEAR